MITVVVTFVMAPEAEVIWEEVWPQTYAAWSQHPGLRAAHLLRDVAQPERYVLHSEWEGREHVNAFVRNSGLLWLIRGLDLFTEHPSFRYFEGGGEAATAL
jgi:heme-degrading monooxygenase HmoA